MSYESKALRDKDLRRRMDLALGHPSGLKLVLQGERPVRESKADREARIRKELAAVYGEKA